MINFFTFIILINTCGLDVSAEKTDTSNDSLWADTAFVQVIHYDSVTFHQFKADKKYDYFHNQLVKGESLRDIIIRFINRYILSPIANSHTANWLIFVAVSVILLSIFYFFRPDWFYINKKKKMDFSVENENIHESDFELFINDALKSEQYADAIRWNYLHALKTLHAKELISWDAHKTVIEYVSELQRPALKADFKEATRQFLYFRYGNFNASQDDWENYRTLIHNMLKKINSSM